MSCSRTTYLGLLISSLLAMAVGLPSWADEIPGILRPDWSEIRSFPADVPVWVSASQALDAHGKLIPGQFRPGTADNLQKLLDRPKDPATGCTRWLWIEQEYVDPPDRSSISAAVASSAMVVVGKVVASEVGFERGEVGQMLMIQPIEQIKPARVPPRAFFVFVPAGRLKFSRYDICKEDPRVVIPEMGDEVVLFPRYASADELYLNLEYEGSLVVFGAAGQVRWPRIMLAGAARSGVDLETRSGMLEEIRAQVQKEKP